MKVIEVDSRQEIEGVLGGVRNSLGFRYAGFESQSGSVAP